MVVAPGSYQYGGVTFALLKGFDVALARHGVAMESGLHLRASIRGKTIEVFRGAQRVRMMIFKSDNIANLRPQSSDNIAEASTPC